MQCYTELTPPTAVTHSVALPFVSAQSSNLVVAKSSLLQIFTTKLIPAELDAAQSADDGAPSTAAKQASRYDSRLANDDDGLESSFLGGDNVLVKTDRSNNAKLVLVAEIPLSGTVTGLARIKTPTVKSNGGDALLVAFRDAKLSLVEWDPQRSALNTISIHYYEQDELQGSPWAAPLGDYVNFLAADPGSRCAALKFGPRNLAILPFRQPDEDMDMDDWDEELDGPRPAAKDQASTAVNGTSNGISNGTANGIEETPYSPSFVLRLPRLDPSLLHPVHLAFLHEYREPTFGILSSTQNISHSLGRRDHLSYMVFTLDLQQKASTTILSVGGLPQDLFRVVALPAPLGGALLVGTDELIHVDQSGKLHGVALNPFARQSTSLGLVDQSDLGLRLEGCVVDVLSAEAGELLLVLRDGRLALVTFRVDGRTVSGLTVRLVPDDAGGRVLPCGLSCLSRVGRAHLFAGSEDGDSFVLGWSRKQSAASRRKSRIHHDAAAAAAGLENLELDYDGLGGDGDGDDDDDDIDEDDLYGDEAPTTAQPATSAADAAKAGGEMNFRIHDRLTSIAPIRAMTYGQPYTPTADGEETERGVQSPLNLTCAVGRDGAGALAVLNREIQPRIIGRFEFPEARGFWTMCARKPMPKAIQGDRSGSHSHSADYEASNPHDKFMIVAKVDLDGYETSDVYALTGAGFETLAGTEFEPAAGFTVEAGTMGKHTRIIQVLKSEVRCYDGDLGLSQILPMLDEETGLEPRVVGASIADPFLLLVRDDSSVFVAQMDANSELEELDKDDQTLASSKWVAGCLYLDTGGLFAETADSSDAKAAESVVMFLLNAAGALYIYRLPNLKSPVFVAQGLSYIPPYLSAGYSARKGTAKESLSELLVADLGDAVYKSPYLILRHANDDLTLYQPLRHAHGQGSGLSETLSFQKLPNPVFAQDAPDPSPQDETPHLPRFLPLRPCANVSGYSTVFLPGHSPSFLLKSAKSIPRLVGLAGSGALAMSPFHTEGCDHGFIYADSQGIARVTELPADRSYAELGAAVLKIPLGVDAAAVSYHPPAACYVVGCNAPAPFELPRDDDYHREWAREPSLALKPTAERGLLKLVTPVNWSVVDHVDMDPCEAIACVETLSLEVSEATHERRQLVAVGTAIARGEDLPIRGRVHVYEIADVIPEPGRPETGKRLKLVAREEIPRGAVTALTAVGTQGLMLVAQGQKCMVRGLKEDGTLLPVAFMDMNCHVAAVKELPGTGLCLMADAFKGLWFTGYTEEPYKMVLFGKSASRLELLNADFLPDGRELFIAAADADGNLHILQFDPEHPKSLQGHLLLHRTSFSVGAHIPTSSLLLPSTAPLDPTTAQAGDDSDSSSRDGDAAPPQRHLLLLAAPTGVLAALTPLSEPSYRRLASLTAQLAGSAPPAAGLNPRAYRLPSSSSYTPLLPGVDAGVGRSIVDGTLLSRWAELGAGRRSEVAGRVGFAAPDDVRGELRHVLGWAGLGYF